MPVNGRFDGTTRADVQRDAGASSRGRPALRRKRPQPSRGTWLSAGGCSGRRVATKRVVRLEPQITAEKSRAGQGWLRTCGTRPRMTTIGHEGSVIRRRPAAGQDWSATLDVASGMPAVAESCHQWDQRGMSTAALSGTHRPVGRSLGSTRLSDRGLYWILPQSAGRKPRRSADATEEK